MATTTIIIIIIIIIIIMANKCLHLFSIRLSYGTMI